MIKLVIDRRTWLRGEGSVVSYLLRKQDKKKCCLGFACQQIMGLTEKQVVEESNPFYYVADMYGLFYEQNDNKELKDKQREAILTKNFASIGIEVTFEN